MNNQNKTKTRNSNIELLRIISMLLIVAFHCAGQIGYKQYDNTSFVYITSVLLGSWGILGVDVFVIISAYYLVDQRLRVTRVINVLFQTFTYLIGFAIVVPEAMACGLPVLSTKCTGPTEILDNGEYGMLVSSDSNGVYEGIKSYLDNPSIINEYKNQSQKRYMDFDENTIVEQIMALF